MTENGEASAVLNRVQDELVKLRREQRSCIFFTSLCIVFALATTFYDSSRESSFAQTSWVILMFAGVVDLKSIRRSIRMMESVASMFPRRISDSDASAV